MYIDHIYICIYLSMFYFLLPEHCFEALLKVLNFSNSSQPLRKMGDTEARTILVGLDNTGENFW